MATSRNGNPVVDVRTGERHADGRLGGLDSEQVMEEVSGRGATRVGATEFIVSEKQKCQGKFIYPSHTFLINTIRV